MRILGGKDMKSCKCIFIISLSLILFGCGELLDMALIPVYTAAKQCSEFTQADGREITHGVVYKDKYESECIKISGRVKGLSSDTLRRGGGRGNVPFVVILLEVPNGVSPLRVYAEPEFDKTLKTLQQDQEVDVFGRVYNHGDNRLILLLGKIKIGDKEIKGTIR